MKELDVRIALHEFIKSQLIKEQPDSLIIDELGLIEGSFRVDVAVINDRLHGFEIKSPSDNLLRLPAQQKNYSKIFDKMTIVCADRYVAQAVDMIPKWWGLVSVSVRDGMPYLNEIWPSRQNMDVNPFHICQLLWREEALAVMKEHGMDYGFRTKGRRYMWKAMAKELPLDTIRKSVKQKLSTRIGWR
ncbi:MAG: sce7726 family protein [Candidatus Obscuribacterales bacterium]|nr:sce7726 family protein [Candidatus Obscuribacterales bacterium]